MGDRKRGTLVPPGIVLGVGFGGFVDGIVLHQMLQWHHMLTAHNHGQYAPTTLDALEINTLWDGLFHSSTWLAALVGVAMLWLAARNGARWSAAVLAGAMLAGWGLFNLIEGIVDHHILGLHHVRDDLGGPLSWDVGFLILGALLVTGGWLVIRAGNAAHEVDCVGVDQRRPQA